MANNDGTNQDNPHKINGLELIKTLKSNLENQTEVCKKLESFADRLPDDIDATECLPLANEVLKSLEQAHQFEELILFPILQERFYADNQLFKTLERLRSEHLEDDSFAQELKVCLTDFSRTRQIDNVNMLGYMLRGFFENVRRHTAFEREHILPMLEQSA